MLTDWSRVHLTFLTLFLNDSRHFNLKVRGFFHKCSYLLNNPHFFLTDRSWHLQMDSKQKKIRQDLSSFAFIKMNYWIATSNIFQKINYTLSKIKYRLTVVGFEDGLSNQRPQQISCFSSRQNNVQPVKHIRHWLQIHAKKKKKKQHARMHLILWLLCPYFVIVITIE